MFPRLQQLDRVAQLRGAFVKLLCNRSLHLALHDLQFGKRALCFHFLKPFLEKCDLGALRYQFRKVWLLQEFRDCITAVLNFAYGFGKLPWPKKNRRLAARVHHEHVSSELLEAPGKFLAIRVLGNKREKIEIALCIADYAFEIIDLKQA